MQSMDVKRMALEALRKKIAKLELETEMGEEVTASDDMDIGEEKGIANITEAAREEAEVDALVDGEDGEKGVSIEMELESEDPAAAEGMTELYKRMSAEFGAEPESRKAGGLKRALTGGGCAKPLFGKKSKK